MIGMATRNVIAFVGGRPLLTPVGRVTTLRRRCSAMTTRSALVTGSAQGIGRARAERSPRMATTSSGSTSWNRTPARCSRVVPRRPRLAGRRSRGSSRTRPSRHPRQQRRGAGREAHRGDLRRGFRPDDRGQPPGAVPPVARLRCRNARAGTGAASSTSRASPARTGGMSQVAAYGASKGGLDCPDQELRPQLRPIRRDRECGRSGRDPDADGRFAGAQHTRASGRRSSSSSRSAATPSRPSSADGRRVPRLERARLHDRRDDRRQRRLVHVLNEGAVPERVAGTPSNPAPSAGAGSGTRPAPWVTADRSRPAARDIRRRGAGPLRWVA